MLDIIDQCRIANNSRVKIQKIEIIAKAINKGKTVYTIHVLYMVGLPVPYLVERRCLRRIHWIKGSSIFDVDTKYDNSVHKIDKVQNMHPLLWTVVNESNFARY